MGANTTNRKKTRCTGKQPCQICTRDGIECEFKTPNLRGKMRNKSRTIVSSAVISTLSPLSSVASETASQPQSQFQSVTNNNGQLPTSPIPQGQAEAVATGQSSRVSPEPGESDQQGYFVGSSSGLSFLLRLQRRLRQETEEIAKTSVFTLGDPVLPDFDALSFVPPPRYEADMLLKTYFELSAPTYRFLHRPTVEGWIHQLYENGRIQRPQSHSKYAVILAMFAQATQYVGGDQSVNYTNG